ncbi:MAG: hypothetical protein V1843_00655 [bacterium]
MFLFLLISELFLVLLWGWCLYAIINPKEVVAWTVERYENSMKFYGFQAKIKPTKRSARIIRTGHLLVLILLSVYIVLLYVLLK